MTGSLLVAGTTSDAGKSLLTAGICRSLARRGVKVAPFKAQNMSNNSVALADGGEIGRAQAVQAAACGIEPEAAMNPVLLKPGSDRSSHVVLLGRRHAEVSAATYPELKQTLRRAVLAAFDDLAGRFEWWSARGPAARPRSTCAATTSPTSAWPGPGTSR